MQIELRLTGKNDAYVEGSVALYKKRLERYARFSVNILREEKNGKNVLDKIVPADLLILLDEKGKQLSSKGLADFVNKTMMSGKKKAVFLIGGAYGFDKEIYDRANELLSLSKMTLSHQIARVVFMEQLYRAFTIINNEPYHHS